MPPTISTPPPTSPEDGRRLARQRVWARKQRTRGIRRRVAVITLSLFVAVWVAIFVPLVTGHDPALGAGTKSQTSTTATPATTAKKSSAPAASAATSAQAASSGTDTSGTTTDGSSSGSGSNGSSGSTSSDSSSGSSSSAAPVTTSQS